MKRALGVLAGSLLLLTAVMALSGSAFAENCALAIDRVQCEYLNNPLGIDVRAPRLSWIVTSTQRGQLQSAYEILVASSPDLLAQDKGDRWSTGKVISSATCQIAYQGAPLQSRDACWWKVRVWDREGQCSGWSSVGHWTMGLLDAADWKASWIGQPVDTFPKKTEAPGPLFRKTFALPDQPVRAVLYAAAMGYQEVHLNGNRVDKDEICGPPVSDYNKRAYYATYDVTDKVSKGDNALGVWLGRGWYCRDFPGVTHPGPIARVQLEVTLASGETVCIASDDSWKMHAGPVTALVEGGGGNLNGEIYNAQAELPGWDKADFNDRDWTAVVPVQPETQTLSAIMMEPNRAIETLTPVSLTELSPNEYMFDLGRNITGQIEMQLNVPLGSRVRFHYPERKDPKTGSWIDYDQMDVFIPRTDGANVFRSKFNYHAFRYVRVTGLKQTPKLEDLKAFFVQTDYGRCGTFTCSNQLLNTIYDMTLYTFRCVSAGGDTVDCPHRERLGYGGDGQITSKTALYAFQLAPLYTKWLGNWRDVQNPDTGGLPNIAPSPHGAGGGPTWGAFCVFLPWDMYLHYGDQRVLRENYDMMKRYMGFLNAKSENGLLTPYGSSEYGFLGDWVSPGHDQGFGPWSPEEDRTFFNNCFYAYIAAHMAKVAGVLGETQDAAQYAQQADAIRKATHERFFKADQNSYVSGNQASLSFALLSGVAPEYVRPAILANLDKTIRETNTGHLDTGMHGTMFLLRCLDEVRRDDLSFLMINQKTYPGWGYMIEQGATTFWERWDGEFSQIHSTLLAAGEWFPRSIGGIRTDETKPGFQRVIIDPRPVGEISWARSGYDTIHGLVVSAWKIENGQFTLDVSIPANATAQIHLPTTDPASVTENGKPISSVADIKSINATPGAVFETNSGAYHFTCAYKQ